MSIIKDVRDLSGKNVFYNGVRIRDIEVPAKFINTIPCPLPTKKYLS
jgi:hypothetical protein